MLVKFQMTEEKALTRNRSIDMHRMSGP